MSFLTRLAARARPGQSGMPAIVPKGVGAAPAAPALYREAGPEEELLSLMRETGGQAAPGLVAPSASVSPQVPAASVSTPARAPTLRRASEEEEEDELQMMRAPASPAAAPPATQAALRRESAEMAEDDPEEIQPLRQPGQTRPVSPAPRASVTPGPTPPRAGTASPPAHVPPAPAPSPAASPTSDTAAGTPKSPGPAAQVPASVRPWLPRQPDFTAPDAPTRSLPQQAPSTSQSPERAEVIIDKIDVLIHEPAAPASAPAPRQDTGRALRARYLRRL